MPPARIELATFALQVQRSTTKLKGHSYRNWRLTACETQKIIKEPYTKQN